MRDKRGWSFLTETAALIAGLTRGSMLVDFPFEEFPKREGRLWALGRKTLFAVTAYLGKLCVFSVFLHCLPGLALAFLKNHVELRGPFARLISS